MGRLLLISNGHGEDAIGARLVAPLRAAGWAVEALPIVGLGLAYEAEAVPRVGPAAVMPSGGFIYGRPGALARDLRAGLISLTRAQWQALHADTARWNLVIAVGDVVPLAFAWSSGLPYGFVGCAKSDWYAGGRPGCYGPHERWLMRRPQCIGVWPRDEVTTRNLQAAGVGARWLGNPMMDGLDPLGLPLPEPEAGETIALLPGSRAEWVQNLARLAATVQGVAQPGRRFLAALAPGADPGRLAVPGWTTVPGPPAALEGPRGVRIWLLPDALADVLQAAAIVLATAGTATEQAVGCGVPAVTLPGPGPQFTAAFAKAQARLLGDPVQVAGGPEEAALRVEALLAGPEERARLAEAGRQRMGPPGAAFRIVATLPGLPRTDAGLPQVLAPGAPPGKTGQVGQGL